MLVQIRFVSVTLAILMALGLVLAACATQPAPASPAPQAPAKAEPAPAAAPTKAAAAPAAPEKPAPAAAAPKPAGPQVGGTLVYAMPTLGPSLDPHAQNAEAWVLQTMGAGLVTRDLATGEVIPHLAESWTVSDDGLTYQFKLKKNVKWQDGTPLTPKDFVYTIERARSKSAFGAVEWQALASYQAPDDSTLVLKLKAPDAGYLSSLATYHVYSQPVPKDVVEKLGDKFATEPVLSGPFKLKEFQMGSKIVLERNPDYQWGPSWGPGPAYLQNIELRAVREYATILAGLESGEIDIADVQAKDVERLKATGKVRIEQSLDPSLKPTLEINASRAPWDDVRVRQAVNLALDRQAMIKVAALGYGVEMKGPIPSSVYGYWPGVEKIGYGLDLNRAKALMKEAGYAPGSDGILAKDGKPLKFTLDAWDQEPFTKVATMVQEQLKALGIAVEIKLMPRQEAVPAAVGGKYDLMVGWQPGAAIDARLAMKSYFHSSMIGGRNMLQVSDPQLDALIEAALKTTDTAKSLEYVAQAQKMAVEKAYSVPLYQTRMFWAVSNRVKGLIINDKTGYPMPRLQTAYIEGGR